MTVIPLLRHGRWAWDLRGEGRGVRISTHVDVGLLNLSLWRDGTCVGTVQLRPAEVATLASGLTEGLAEIAAQPGVSHGGAGDAWRVHELELRLAEVEARLGASGTGRAVAAAATAVRERLVARGLRAVIRSR
ncbi:hypothetical protein SAMN05660485_02141 [Blastococcus fimeti]|nr:hypothetical protein SAMN05660485_02141 [Blastococcus fimeti]